MGRSWSWTWGGGIGEGERGAGCGWGWSGCCWERGRRWVEFGGATGTARGGRFAEGVDRSGAEGLDVGAHAGEIGWRYSVRLFTVWFHQMEAKELLAKRVKTQLGTGHLQHSATLLLGVSDRPELDFQLLFDCFLATKFALRSSVLALALRASPKAARAAISAAQGPFAHINLLVRSPRTSQLSILLASRLFAVNAAKNIGGTCCGRSSRLLATPPTAGRPLPTMVFY